jgi:hypothetical protein
MVYFHFLCYTDFATEKALRWVTRISKKVKRCALTVIRSQAISASDCAGRAFLGRFGRCPGTDQRRLPVMISGPKIVRVLCYREEIGCLPLGQV